MTNITQSLKKYALYLLGRRSYSVYEMRQKLKEKMKKIENYRNRKRLVDLDTADQDFILKQGTEDILKDKICSSGYKMADLVHGVIKYLTDLKLLDDEAYAKTFVQSLQRQNKSSRVIQNKLAQKGIDKEIIEKVFTKDDLKDQYSLTNLINSKLRHSPELLSSKKGKEKLIRFLLYRGFDYGEIKKNIEKLT